LRVNIRVLLIFKNESAEVSRIYREFVSDLKAIWLYYPPKKLLDPGIDSGLYNP